MLPVRKGVVAIIPDGPRLLVIQRSPWVRAPGKYCFPGGALEVGETESQAMEREVREEVGITVLSQHCLWRSTAPSGIQLAWWLARLPHQQPLQLNPAEVAQAMWLTPSQIRGLTGLLTTNHQFLDAWDTGQFVVPC